jgi:diguanylate cyclase (GGDEF)-like protein/PAS domain S-box-containing protein
MQFRLASKLSSQRLRTLVTCTALVIAAIVGANAFVLALLHQSTLRDVQNDLLRQSVDLSELVERTLQSVDLVLGSVAEKASALAPTEDDKLALTGEDFHVFLKEKLSGLPQIHALGIIDADGQRLNFSQYWPVPDHDLSFRAYFKALKADPRLTSYLEAPVKGSVTDRWTVINARPIFARNGKFIGAVFASTDTKYFQDLFSTTLGVGYAAALVRSDWTFITRYPMAGDVGAKIRGPIFDRIANSRSAVDHSVSPVDGQSRVVAAYRLLNYPLAVVVTEESDTAFAGWRAIVFTMCFVTSIVIALIIAAAYLMALSWKQQDRLDAARADVVESEKVRALAEAELNRRRDLAEQSMRLHAAVENISQGMCMFGKDGRLLVCNELYAKMYNLPAELLKPGSLIDDIIAYRLRNGMFKGDQHDADIRQQLEAAWADGVSSRIDEHADGRLIRITRSPLQGGGWVATHQDITEQRKAERELDETKRFLDSIIENIPVAVVVKDVKTRKYVLVNRALETMLDMPRSEFLDRTIFEIYGAKNAEFIDQTDTEALQEGGGGTYQEYELDTPMRGHRTRGARRIVIRDANGEAKYLATVIEDVTERKKVEQRIAFLAHHDPLTGLANRAALTQRIEEAAARQRQRGEPFSVLLLDLDRFKQVNDTLGHPAGDTLLTEVATRLKQLLRETDVLARLGGDEFAIIQAGEVAQREAASSLADRIVAALGKPFEIEGSEVNIGTSIGIALAPEHDTGAGNLLKMADLALYRAKSAGRNGYCFFNREMSEIASARQEIENELRRAILQDELELHYQPIIDAKTRRMRGAEALVRWRHPTKGLILPDRFIPLAEETGLIAQIGEWVLHHACTTAAAWPDDIAVAVNLSLVQFHKTNLPDVVMYALAESGLPPKRLELEITETALIESAAECLPALRQFKNLGITIVLDDFGTGYSSLSQLAMFPFDKIKIDKSFTQNLTKRSECAAIISATLTLAQSLDIATTAEGVETEDQYRLLRLAGVTSVQGYLFKRPVPASEINFDQLYGAPPKENAA